MSARAWRANDRVRIEGSAAVVDAAVTAGVDKVVQESGSMLYADHGDAWIDEDAPTDRYPMARGNHAAEAHAHRVTAGGGVGVVLRFGWFYGPGAMHSKQFLALAQRHVCLAMGRPDSYVSSIHVADAGAAVAAALLAPAGTYTSSMTNHLPLAASPTRSRQRSTPRVGSACLVGLRICSVIARLR
jgi:nucleoside-diphosphate-sugar epimerase